MKINDDKLTRELKKELINKISSEEGMDISVLLYAIKLTTHINKIYGVRTLFLGDILKDYCYNGCNYNNIQKIQKRFSRHIKQ